MQVETQIEPSQRTVIEAQRAGKTVGLVPTMGALHEGHLSLIRASRARCDVTAVTIFVNPIQFGPGEDFERYPTPREADLAACRAEGVDLVFMPGVETMYTADSVTAVHVAGLTEHLCGAHRAGHFDGVTTVVAKLFNILPTDFAFFGEKDYQQLKVVQRMVRDLNMPIEIVSCPTVREPDGLAMSSRNHYLSPDRRQQALSLWRALSAAADCVEQGERSAAAITAETRETILAAGPAEIDYVEVVDAESLEVLEVVDRPARLCLAVRIGPCRLIDNLALEPRTG